MDKNHKRIIFAGLIIFVLVIMLAFAFYSVFLLDGSGFKNISNLFYKIGRFFALVGFFSIFLLIFSGDSARFFDKFFGIDKIIKAQRRFAIFTYFIVFSHPLFIIIGKNSYLGFLVPNLAVIPLAFAAFALYLFIAIMFSSLFYKRISYNVWQYIHIFTYVLFILVWYHAFMIGGSAYFLPIKIIYFVFPVLILIGAIYRFSYKLRQRTNRFIVEGVRRETVDSFTLVVKPKKKVYFVPGQFFFLRIEGEKLYARHPFSVSNSPDEMNLEFTVKIAGRFTKKAALLKRGDEIKVEGPFGNFVLEGEKKPVFIAAGVGITPFMSMIKGNKKVRKKIVLFYGSKTEKDIIFKRDLDEIKEDWLKKIYFLSRQRKKGYEYGRIGAEKIVRYLGNLSEYTFYICGPEEMNESLRKELLDRGVSSSNIVFENFFW